MVVSMYERERDSFNQTGMDGSKGNRKCIPVVLNICVD